MSGPDSRDLLPVAETTTSSASSPAGHHHQHQHQHGGSSSSSSLAASPAQQRRLSQHYRQTLHPGQPQSQGSSSQPHRQQQQQFVVASEEGESQPPPAQQQQQRYHQAHELGSGIITAETDDNNDDAPPPPAAAAAEHDSFPPFEPIFTLLTNATTNTTVHPRVRYLFSDDDDASAVFTAPQADDPMHRALVVDLAPPAAPNGQWSVSWASSLTPDFAVTSSQLSLQQHGNPNGGAAAADNSSGGSSENVVAGSRSVVLRVEGVEREPVGSRPNSLPASGSGIVGRENVEQLVEEFRRRMGVLKKVVEEGERRKDAMARMDEGTHSERGENEAVAPPGEAAAPLVLDDDGTG